MSYVQETLGPTEKYLLRARFNWTYSIGPWLWTLLGVAPLAYVAYLELSDRSSIENPHVILGFCAVPALAALWVIISHYVFLTTTEIAVTSHRFVFKTGLISRNTKEVTLNNIEEINLQQSILGRIFGYGHMTVRGTGVGVIQLPDLDNPIRLRRTIEKAREALRHSNGNGAPAPVQS